MPKRIPSKISNYIKQQPATQTNNNLNQTNNESVIANMDKDFTQAQANMTNLCQDNNTQQIVSLLNKINGQLENLKLQGSQNTGSQQSNSQSQQASAPPQQGKSQQQSDSSGQQASAQGTQQSEIAVSQELKSLFSMLLQEGNKQSNGTQAANASQEQGEQTQSMTANNNQNVTNSSGIAVQTAAQVLAQAQYELSNELEASLKKLKQVISESEKIANKISNLLGEEKNQKQ